MSVDDSGRGDINIKNILYFSAVLPVFTKLPQDTSVEVGRNVEIPCSAHGEPQPILTWRKVGLPDYSLVQVAPYFTFDRSGDVSL